MSNISRTGSRRLRVALLGGATLAASLGLAAPQMINSRVPTADTTTPIDNMDRGRMNDEEPYAAREMLAKQLLN